MEPESTLPWWKEPASDPILSQMNPVHTLQSYFFKDPF
jgi:hypothetical protein